jgi:hypothetical protein
MPILRDGDTFAASTLVRATPEAIYAVFSDVSRFGEWSPETYRTEWLSTNRFRAWNRRRLAAWSLEAIVVEAVPARRFSFVVQAFGGDWTQWTYSVEPADRPGLTRLTEEIRMCRGLSAGLLLFEWLVLLTVNRPKDLQANLERCVERIGAIVESEVGAQGR